jgi:transcriptional accessory protein Tex/SPT6
LDEVQIKQISDEYQYVANLQKRKDEVILFFSVNLQHIDIRQKFV